MPKIKKIAENVVPSVTLLPVSDDFMILLISSLFGNYFIGYASANSPFLLLYGLMAVMIRELMASHIVGVFNTRLDPRRPFENIGTMLLVCRDVRFAQIWILDFAKLRTSVRTLDL